MDGREDEQVPADGVRMIRRLKPLLARLRDEATGRDRAGNRELFYDDVCQLILLTFFNPAMTSLRDLQKASRLKHVRKKFGCSEAALGSLSEALRVFDAERLVEIIQELLGQLPDLQDADARLACLKQIPTAVDGTLLRQLPQVTQACFATRRDQGWKLHTHFEILRGVPVKMTLTNASGKGPASEKRVLKGSVEADRCYITDRGYEEFALFNAIVSVGSSYVCRVRGDHHFTPEAQHPGHGDQYVDQHPHHSDAQHLDHHTDHGDSQRLSPEAIAAGVLEDVVGVMGSPKSRRIEHPDHRQRRIIVRHVLHPKRTQSKAKPDGHDIVLVTNLLEVPVEVVVLLYRYRWMIELFFRWLKCVLSCRHLISQSANGIQIQMYCALIACLLIQLAAGSDIKPDQWTYKLLCLHQQGLASEEDVLKYVRSRAQAAKKSS